MLLFKKSLKWVDYGEQAIVDYVKSPRKAPIFAVEWLLCKVLERSFNEKLKKEVRDKLALKIAEEYEKRELYEGMEKQVDNQVDSYDRCKFCSKVLYFSYLCCKECTKKYCSFECKMCKCENSSMILKKRVSDEVDL